MNKDHNNHHNSMLNEIINIVTGKKITSNEAGLLNHAKKRRKKYIRQRITTVLAAIMVFVVTYAMILPAITMTKADQTLVCAYETHEHTEACYRDVIDENGNVIGKELICGQADWTVHEHTDDCFAEITDADGNVQKILVCNLPEIKEHRHDATCYQDNQVLICGKEESAGHTHDETCYSIENVLTCSVEEHVHDDSCYQEVVNSQLVLVCGKEDPEHVHDDSCYEEVQTTERVLVCGKEEHQHGAECYEEVKTLICGQAEAEEHHHDASCYETQKVLVCGQIELHTHTKDCYEKDHENDPAYLICGKTELKAHTHGAGCLVKGKAADEEIIKAAEEASAERLAKAESLVSMSAFESTPAGVVEDETAVKAEVEKQVAEVTEEELVTADSENKTVFFMEEGNGDVENNSGDNEPVAPSNKAKKITAALPEDSANLMAADSDVTGSITVNKEVQLTSGVNNSDINTTAYFGLWDIDEDTYLKDSDGHEIIVEIPIVNGVAGAATFTDVPEGNYSVWERKKLSDGTYADLVSGVDTVNDAGEFTVSVFSSMNQASITSTNQDASVTIQNIYKPAGETTSFTTQKIWASVVNQTNGWKNEPPNNAWALFELYANGKATGKTILLDGNTDSQGENSNWVATFTNLPTKDSNGDTITYSVKEKDYDYTPSDSAYKYYYPINDTSSTDGGFIVNRLEYGTLKIHKDFVFNNGYKAATYIPNLKFKITGPYGYEEIISFKYNGSDSADIYNFNTDTKIEDLPAGVYRVEEIGAETLLPDRSWDAESSGSDTNSPVGDDDGTTHKGQTYIEVLVRTSGNSNNVSEARFHNKYIETSYINLDVVKEWDDFNNSAGLRPSSIQVQLKANGNDYGDPVTLSESNNWSYMWKNVDKANIYTLEEITNISGYVSTIEKNGNHFVITNTLPGKGDLLIKKAVTGDRKDVATGKTFRIAVMDPDGKYLNADGTTSSDVVWHEIQDGGQLLFEDLEASSSKKYTIIEEDASIRTPAGITWTKTFTGADADGKVVVGRNAINTVTVTNTYTEPPEDKHINIGLEKIWDDGNGNTIPPSGASATFTVHQQKSTKSGADSDGSIQVTITNGQGTVSDSIKCDPGDTLVIEYSGNPYSGDNIMVQNGSNSWDYSYNYRAVDSSGKGSFEYTIDAVYSGSSLNIKSQNNGLNITDVSLKGGQKVSYSDYEDTSFSQTITLPTTTGAWSTTIRNLVQEDDDGNLYRYYITEDSCTPTAISTSYANDLGKDAVHAIITNGQVVEVTNIYEKSEEKGSVKVTKTFSGITTDQLPELLLIS